MLYIMQEWYVVDKLWYTGAVVNVQEGYIVDRLCYRGAVVNSARGICCRLIVL